MLSEREARSLRKIEKQLGEDDPRFAAFMNRPVFDRRERHARRSYNAVLVIAVIATVLCVALAGQGCLGAGLVAAGFAGLTGYLRWRRFAHKRR